MRRKKAEPKSTREEPSRLDETNTAVLKGQIQARLRSESARSEAGRERPKSANAGATGK